MFGVCVELVIDNQITAVLYKADTIKQAEFLAHVFRAHGDKGFPPNDYGVRVAHVSPVFPILAREK